TTSIRGNVDGWASPTRCNAKRSDDAARRAPGRRLEPAGDGRPRWMTAPDRIPLTDRLPESPAYAGLSHSGSGDESAWQSPPTERRRIGCAMGLRRHRGDEPGGERFLMREKLLSIGDDFWIENAEGERAYKVNGKALRLRQTFVLEDASGDEVARIQERK